MRLESPWFLLLLLALPSLAWLKFRLRHGPGAAIRFSWTGNAARAGRSLRQRLRAFLPWLRWLAMVLLIVALARPQKGTEQIQEKSEGIAIEMVVDRSGSMGEEMQFGGKRLNRLEVVKRVFQDFVLGDGRGLPGRGNDLVGMISFARFAETTCPLTLGHGALPRFLETVQLARTREEDGTAIGDAIALAAARLKTAEDVLKQQAPDRAEGYELKSRIMILLTDGRQNRGEREPLEAARLAKEWGIRIYTIGVGGGESVRGQDTIWGRFLQMGSRNQVDTDTLQSIARETGGEFFMAGNARALQQIYQKIDELERSEIISTRYVDYRELFLPFALTGFFLIIAEMGLNATVFRKIP